MKKPVIDHFGILAPFYEFFIRPRTPRKILNLANTKKGDKVLDAGGGTGRIAQFLASSEAQIVLLDGSFEMLREAQKKNLFFTVLSTTENLPIQNSFFDCIIMVDALHHVADQQKSILELWRLIKPGGRIIIEEPNYHFFGTKLLALAEKIALMRSHMLTPEQILAFFDGLAVDVYIETEGAMCWIIANKI